MCYSSNLACENPLDGAIRMGLGRDARTVTCKNIGHIFERELGLSTIQSSYKPSFDIGHDRYKILQEVQVCYNGIFLAWRHCSQSVQVAWRRDMPISPTLCCKFLTVNHGSDAQDPQLQEKPSPRHAEPTTDDAHFLAVSKIACSKRVEQKAAEVVTRRPVQQHTACLPSDSAFNYPSHFMNHEADTYVEWTIKCYWAVGRPPAGARCGLTADT